MNTTKLNLYVELLNELNAKGIDFEQQDQMQLIAIPDGSDSWLTVEVWKDGYVGGVAKYSNADNFMNYSNVGCPDFNNVEDAIDWLV
jgi:hypothetical protein